MIAQSATNRPILSHWSHSTLVLLCKARRHTPPPPLLLLPHNTKHLILISSASNNLHLQRLPPSILFPCLYPSNISSFHFVCLNLSPFMQCTIAISTTTTTTTSASSDNRSIINNNKNKNKKQSLRKGCFSFVSAE